jgi:16S rRNA C1402 N4-methylase RsmH
MPSSLHDPVLLEGVLELFEKLPKKSHRIIVDATL